MSIAIRPFCWTESLRWLDWYAVLLGSKTWKTPRRMSRKTLIAIRTSTSVKPSWLRRQARDRDRDRGLTQRRAGGGHLDRRPAPEGGHGAPLGQLRRREGEAIARAREHVHPAAGGRQLGLVRGKSRRIRRVEAVQVCEAREGEATRVLENLSGPGHGERHPSRIGDLSVPHREHAGQDQQGDQQDHRGDQDLDDREPAAVALPRHHGHAAAAVVRAPPDGLTATSRQDVCDEFCTRSVPEAVAAPSELNVILGPRTMRTALSILIQPEPSVPAPTQTRPPGHGVAVPEQNRSRFCGDVWSSTLNDVLRVIASWRAWPSAATSSRAAPVVSWARWKLR